jgi:hypothetical protein
MLLFPAMTVKKHYIINKTSNRKIIVFEIVLITVALSHPPLCGGEKPWVQHQGAHEDIALIDLLDNLNR